VNSALAESHWKSSEELNIIEDDLRRFPNCAFATSAKARIKQLSTATQLPKARAT
jgi:hypothetical protein